MKTQRMKFHTDPGHGWLEVSRADLDALGIANRITPYSFQKADRVYLEEDIDAGLYMETARAAGYRLTLDSNNHSNDYSPIRDFPRFAP